MSWLGLDIGGANIKLADGQGYAHSEPFALWKTPDQLTDKLSALLAQAPDASQIAVTMTGELADCYETKAAGVKAILSAAEQAVGDQGLVVYLCDGRLVSIEEALKDPILAAASNWHALASLATRYCDESSGLLLDIGSTTSDIIPLSPAGPAATGRTDLQRLASGELVYTGVERTPVCAIVSELNHRGKPCPVARELFATSGDAYTLLRWTPAEPDNLDTADGRPQTKPYAQARLARMLCTDTNEFSYAEAMNAAETIAAAQIAELTAAARRVIEGMNEPPQHFILSGQGEFLAQRVVEELQRGASVISLANELGPEVSRAACAHAVAVLAAERATKGDNT